MDSVQNIVMKGPLAEKLLGALLAQILAQHQTQIAEQQQKMGLRIVMKKVQDQTPDTQSSQHIVSIYDSFLFRHA